MNTDLLHEWTEELASDPRSLVFVHLADLLRRGGRLDEARRVALRGLERHPYLADGHDVLARIHADAGDAAEARDEWEMALRLDPRHSESLKGLGFLAYRRRDLPTAERLLAQAVQLNPADDGLMTAFRQVQAELRDGAPPAPRRVSPTPSRVPVIPRATSGSTPFAPAGSTVVPEALFASLLGDGDRTALLLDRDGLVLAGTYVDSEGREVAEEIGAHLSGLGEEAARALEHLGLGRWESLLVEAQHATVALGPAVDGAVVLVAAARDTQVGLVRRLLTRARQRAATWLEAVT